MLHGERTRNNFNDFGHWIPVFAGMTDVKRFNCVSPMTVMKLTVGESRVMVPASTLQP